MPDKVFIRHYRKEDRRKVRKICYETAFMGRPPEAFFDDREILADMVSRYYTDYEPESIFVAEYERNIAGYLTGATDTDRCRKVTVARIVPAVLCKAVFRGTLFRPKVARFLYHSTISFLKGEFKTPCLKEYPAHLHINIAGDYRRMGIGSKLMENYLRYLKDKNIKAVHLTTVSKDAVLFFKKKGFEILSSRLSTYLRYLLERNLTVYTLIRKGSLKNTDTHRYS